MGVWSGGVSGLRGLGLRGASGLTPPNLPAEMATAAVDTHPTGMHSCFKYFSAKLSERTEKVQT